MGHPGIVSLMLPPYCLTQLLINERGELDGYARYRANRALSLNGIRKYVLAYFE